MAVFAEIEAQRPTLATATPERQRLALTAWIARARAAEVVLGGTWADRKVGEVAAVLQRLSRLWWPGSIVALDSRSTPPRAWPGLSLDSWREVAAWCGARLPGAEAWADDAAREPPPHDAAALFQRACEVLGELGGPLGEPVAIDRASGVLAAARRQLSRLTRTAAELRWLRGRAPADAWGNAIGRLRGLARGLNRDGEGLAGVLAPALVPLKGWAVHLGRDPVREWVIGSIPATTCSDATLLGWLVQAFDVFDTPTLAGRCSDLRLRIAALRPDFADRRHRRRFDQLRDHLNAQPVASTSGDTPGQVIADRHAEDPRLAALREQLRARRALFVSNRSAPEIEKLIAEKLDLACEAVAAVGNPRRRQALIQRIHRGSYDVVLVAHGFSGHAETEQLGEACRQVGTVFCAVDKGRIARIVDVLWHHRNHPRIAGPSAA